jgi:hypothetical protein
MPFVDRSPLEYPTNTTRPLDVRRETRAPIDDQDGLKSRLLTLWHDTFNENVYILVVSTTTQSVWKLVASASSLYQIAVDTFTGPGTNPVLPTGAGLVTFTGAQVVSGTVGANVIRTDSLAASSITFEIQQAGSAAAQDTTLNGVAHFDSAHFTVTNGFVQLAGGGAAIDQIAVDASTPPGTNPVVPDGTGQVTITGAQVATGTVGANVIRSNSLAANTFTIEIQRTTTAAATDSTLNGVSHFDSAAFTVDANGFVSLPGGGAPIEEFLVSSGTSPVVPNGSGQITLTDGNGVGMTGGLNAITFDMVSPFTGDFTFTGTVTSETTFNVNPGSDTDTDLLTVTVTGSPSISWDESEDGFLIDRGVIMGDTVGSLSHIVNGATVNSNLELHATATQSLGGLTIHRHSNTANQGGNILNLRSDGTHAVPTIVSDGDALSRYLGAGYDGTDYALCAEIRCEVDGTPGNNDMPGRWLFLTSPDGTQVPVEGMRISQDQSISFTQYTQNALLYVGASGEITEIGPLTDGQLIIGDTGSNPVAANLTSTGGTITITNGAGSINLETVAGGTVVDFTVPAGTSPVVPDGTGTIDLPAGNGFQFTGGLNSMTGAMTSPFTGDFTFTDSTAGNTELLTVSNTDNTAANASSAALALSVAGTTQIGDPYVQYSVGSTIAYSTGVDTSSTNQLFRLTYDAAATVDPSSGTNLITAGNNGVKDYVAFFTDSGGPAAITNTDINIQKTVAGGIVGLGVRNNDNTNAASHAGLVIQVAGTSAGDPFLVWSIPSGTPANFCMGRDNSDSDVLKITNSDRPSLGTEFWRMTSVGEFTMPTQPAFLATQTTAQNNLPINATTTFTINNEIYDQNGDYDNTTYTFTSPVTGRYDLRLNVRLNDIDTANSFYIFRIATSNRNYSWTIPVATYFTADASCSFSFSTYADMDATDTALCSIQIANAGASQADVQVVSGADTWTTFSGALIC